MTSTAQGTVAGNTLREALEIRRVRGERFTLREAIAVIVPFSTHVASLHAEGRQFFLSPAAIDFGRAGADLLWEVAQRLPTHERDRACVAPEARRGQPGDARASVFSIGAILYEMLTGQSVGPGMKRPTEAVPSLPAAVESILGKALVADAKHRPNDIAALAQALHQVAPTASMPPPAADITHLDHDVGFDVDVSLSMLPPAPSERPPPYGAPQAPASHAGAPASSPGAPTSVPQAVASQPFRSPLEGRAVAEPPPSQRDPQIALMHLKARLEADPRPRYVVVKDGMDHGPFTAVELLQQVASHAFLGSHVVRDTISQDEKPIDAWAEFSQFAEQAQLNREIKQEKRAFEAVVHREKVGTRYKALIGATIIGVLAAAGLGIWARERANSKRNEVVHADESTLVDVDAGIGMGKDGKPVGGGGRVLGGGGGTTPQIAGGGSCESAIAKYTEEYNLQGGTGKPDLGAADYGNVLNRGGYLNACGVPSNMSVDICVAVQSGRAVGVTVRTNPSNPGISSCISGQVRGLGFPAHPRMDVARTSFAAQ